MSEMRSTRFDVSGHSSYASDVSFPREKPPTPGDGSPAKEQTWSVAVLLSPATETRYHLPRENNAKSKTAHRDSRSRVTAARVRLNESPRKKDISPPPQGYPRVSELRDPDGRGNNRETSGRDPAESTCATFVFGRRLAKRVQKSKNNKPSRSGPA